MISIVRKWFLFLGWIPDCRFWMSPSIIDCVFISIHARLLTCDWPGEQCFSRTGVTWDGPLSSLVAAFWWCWGCCMARTPRVRPFGRPKGKGQDGLRGVLGSHPWAWYPHKWSARLLQCVHLTCGEGVLDRVTLALQDDQRSEEGMLVTAPVNWWGMDKEPLDPSRGSGRSWDWGTGDIYWPLVSSRLDRLPQGRMGWCGRPRVGACLTMGQSRVERVPGSCALHSLIRPLVTWTSANTHYQLTSVQQCFKGNCPLTALHQITDSTILLQIRPIPTLVRYQEDVHVC